MQGANLKHSTTYHPETDGQSMVVNNSLEMYLRCFTSEKPRSWAKWLSLEEYWYNMPFHVSTRCSRFKAVYGREPPQLINYERGLATVSEIDQLLEDREEILDNLSCSWRTLSTALSCMQTLSGTTKI